MLKLESPMFLHFPSSTSFSRAAHVSAKEGGVESNSTLPSASCKVCISMASNSTLISTFHTIESHHVLTTGKRPFSWLGSVDKGQWIRYKSRYSSCKSASVLAHALGTSSGRWKEFHSLLVMNTSSRLTSPAPNTLENDSPISASFW